MDIEQTTPQKPTLKKIKRPINRMPLQQAPSLGADVSTQKKETANPIINKNPFVEEDQTRNITQNNEDSIPDEAFNLDKFLDEEQLPAVAERKLKTEETSEEQFEYEFNQQSLDTNYRSNNLPKGILLVVGLSILFIGVVIGKLFFNNTKVVRNGLQGVVINQEIPKGRARCGVAERNQGCVLYIMNPQRQDMIARDFYDLASQVTGRQRFIIETGNMRYSNTKIRPGDIVQLNIPPL